MRTLSDYAQLVEARLGELIPAAPPKRFAASEMPWLLADSMRYSLLAGGKRLRPSMLLAAVEMLGGDPNEALDYACAVEMIHTYSLIHDDLPGMDDDTMRRGRPTNHVVFGVGQAILAGDGLLNFAFETMLAAALRRPERAAAGLSAIAEIARGSGVTGMIAGQALDLYCERERIADVSALEAIQRGKTACMFLYPLRAAARLQNADEAILAALTDYGTAFGLLFQATDDLLDVVGSAEAMGKTLGKDAASGKLTCVSAYGVDGTRALVEAQHRAAVEALSIFGERASFFVQLVDGMVSRTH